MIPLGYLCAFASLFFFRPGLAVAGLVIGIGNGINGHPVHGITQVLISVVCGILGICIELSRALANFDPLSHPPGLLHRPANVREHQSAPAESVNPVSTS